MSRLIQEYMFIRKKLSCVFLILVLAVPVLISEPVIVDWLGSEEGVSADPKWLWKYTDEQNESLLRKKFKLAKTDLFFLGVSESSDVNGSLRSAEIKALAMASAKINKECGMDVTSSAFVSALERRFVFWQKISDSEEELDNCWYKGFVLYVISAADWEKLKARFK
ncbi:MAG: hypothetical protein II098_05670 [Treponema sp.]|nr:hypothetical protein [Treponema sp.]